MGVTSSSKKEEPQAQAERLEVCMDAYKAYETGHMDARSLAVLAKACGFNVVMVQTYPPQGEADFQQKVQQCYYELFDAGAGHDHRDQQVCVGRTFSALLHHNWNRKFVSKIDVHDTLFLALELYDDHKFTKDTGMPPEKFIDRWNKHRFVLRNESGDHLEHPVFINYLRIDDFHVARKVIDVLSVTGFVGMVTRVAALPSEPSAPTDLHAMLAWRCGEDQHHEPAIIGNDPNMEGGTVATDFITEDTFFQLWVCNPISETELEPTSQYRRLMDEVYKIVEAGRQSAKETPRIDDEVDDAVSRVVGQDSSARQQWIARAAGAEDQEVNAIVQDSHHVGQCIETVMQQDLGDVTGNERQMLVRQNVAVALNGAKSWTFASVMKDVVEKASQHMGHISSLRRKRAASDDLPQPSAAEGM